MVTIDDSTIEGIEISEKSPEQAALEILLELRDVGFGRHRAEVLATHFGDVFESKQDAEEALEGLRARGLAAKSHSKGEMFYRPTQRALSREEEGG